MNQIFLQITEPAPTDYLAIILFFILGPVVLVLLCVWIFQIVNRKYEKNNLK
ncbi:MAG: hypothetical protein JWO92_1512 [Chitinophagaceae bacterium]|nr:hypothetical protein [Chitinophagaceae bacterium]